MKLTIKELKYLITRTCEKDLLEKLRIELNKKRVKQEKKLVKKKLKLTNQVFESINSMCDFGKKDTEWEYVMNFEDGKLVDSYFKKK